MEDFKKDQELREAWFTALENCAKDGPQAQADGTMKEDPFWGPIAKNAAASWRRRSEGLRVLAEGLRKLGELEIAEIVDQRADQADTLAISMAGLAREVP
jgi:hypothetical protein